jgi:hypothetical protein
MDHDGDARSGRSRPAVAGYVADDLVTIASIPYKIVESGRRPPSKNRQNTA